VRPRRTSRLLRRSAVVATTVAGSLLAVATPALALDDGEVKGKPLGIGLVIAIYVLIPLGTFAVIAFFSTLPSVLRRPRYRPGRPWNYDPLWFNGPDDPDRALATARPRATAKGGASAEW
jgi:hypothetical protein